MMGQPLLLTVCMRQRHCTTGSAAAQRSRPPPHTWLLITLQSLDSIRLVRGLYATATFFSACLAKQRRVAGPKRASGAGITRAECPAWHHVPSRPGLWSTHNENKLLAPVAFTPFPNIDRLFLARKYVYMHRLSMFTRGEIRANRL